jgi:hypothetical protein
MLSIGYILYKASEENGGTPLKDDKPGHVDVLFEINPTRDGPRNFQVRS